jgi:hypothetical protein
MFPIRISLKRRMVRHVKKRLGEWLTKEDKEIRPESEIKLLSGTPSLIKKSSQTPKKL